MNTKTYGDNAFDPLDKEFVRDNLLQDGKDMFTDENALVDDLNL
jgi:hypothetical protein